MIQHAAPRSIPPLTWLWSILAAQVILIYEALRWGMMNSTERIVSYTILIIVVAMYLTRLCRSQKEFDLFEPLYLVFSIFMIFYPVRALLAVWLDEPWFDPDGSAYWRALSAAILGFVSFAVGYKLFSNRKHPFRLTWIDRSWNSERANTIALWFLAIGISGFLMIYVLGGSLLYFISLDSDIKAPGSISAWFFYVLWICLFMQVGALIQLGNWFRTGRGALWTGLYCSMALVSTFFLSRYITVLFLTMLALCWHYQKRRIRFGYVVLLFALVLAYLGLAGLYREWISPGYNLDEIGGLAELAGQQKDLMLRYVVGNLEELSNLSDVISIAPSELPYQFGSTFAPLFLKPIPRAVMPSKPLGASALFTEELEPGSYESGFVTALGAWGEWYLNFSWVGLVFGMALMGALAAAAYRGMRASVSFGRVLLFSSVVVVLFTWIRSDFNSASTFGLYYFLPAIFALAYITRKDSGARQLVEG